MARDYIDRLPSMTEIYDLIKQSNYEGAYILAKIRYEATEKMYDYPAYIALRKALFGVDDSIANGLENEIKDKGILKDISSLGDSFKLVGLYDEAIDLYFSCLKEPYFNGVYVRLRDTLREIGRGRDIELLDKKYSNKGFDANIKFLNLKETKGEDGLVKSTEKLEALVKEYPDYLPAIDALASNYVAMGKNDLALPIYEKLYDMADTFERRSKMLVYLAGSKVSLGRADEALSDLRLIQPETIKDQPGLYNRYLSMMIIISKDLNRLSMQIEYSKELCEAFPKTEYYINLAHLYKRSGEYDKINEALYAALECAVTPYERCSANFALIEIALKEHNYDKALECLKECTVDLTFYHEHELAILNTSALIQVKRGEDISHYESHYFINQCKEYSEERAISHIHSHKDNVVFDKEIHSVFDENIDVEDLFYRVKDIIKDINPSLFNAADVYEIELPEVVATIAGYPTKKIKVITLMDTKDIITIYPVALGSREKRLFDMAKEREKEPEREISKARPSRMSQIDKFNQRLAMANNNKRKK